MGPWVHIVLREKLCFIAVHVMLEVNFRVYIFTKKGAPKRARFFKKGGLQNGHVF